MMVVLPARDSGSEAAATISGRTLSASSDTPASLYWRRASASRRRASASASPRPGWRRPRPGRRRVPGSAWASASSLEGLGRLLPLDALGLGRSARPRTCVASASCSASKRAASAPRCLANFSASACSRTVASSSFFWRSASSSARRMSSSLAWNWPALTAEACATSTSSWIAARLRLRAFSASAMSASTSKRRCSFCRRADSSWRVASRSLLAWEMRASRRARSISGTPRASR